jgi:signal transduction histidine kinase
MTASYVLVTAAAVVLVEIVGLWLVVPGLISHADRATLVEITASAYADRAMALSASLGRLPTAAEIQLGEPSLKPGAGQAEANPDGRGIRIPFLTSESAAEPVPLALLVAPDGKVVASSYPAVYKVGVPVGGLTGLPGRVRAMLPDTLGRGVKPLIAADDEDVVWAAVPVFDIKRKINPGEPKPQFGPPTKGDLLGDPLGVVYVQVPASLPLAGASRPLSALLPQLGVGLLVLLAAVPVGLVFGLVSTRGLVGRVRRLADTTVAVADGDLRQRVPVSGRDEVGQLEHNFNRMAEQLSAAMDTERQLAGATERARIARELHDAISQDLFSVRMLAGGLRKALPEESPLGHQVQTMEQTATRAVHEMQALLLELRPVALESAGLVPALEELCDAYRERLGVTVEADLEPVELDPPVEHAVLRVVQEALANAARHAQPTRIGLRLHPDGDHVAVTVSDDGAGFDPARAEERHGMGLGLMRERVEELGGTFALTSSTGDGTTLHIRIPRGARGA